MDKKYFLGLDIGTSSVGWAVSDENFNLLKLKGKTAWGARLFDEANDAKARRSKRSMRRRMARRRYRIYLLNEYVFGKEIEKVDPTFFLRLSESNLVFDDKDEKAKVKYPLFINKTEEKEFFKLYPTIYHLRKAQIENDPKAFSDIRYLYLSVHHIIKKRGNFLTEGTYDPNKPVTNEMVEEVNDMLTSFIQDNADDDDYFDETIIDMSTVDNIRRILDGDKKDKNKKDKQKEIIALFKKGSDIFSEKEDQKAWDELIDLLAKTVTGGKKTIKDENENSVECDFNRNYEETRPEYENILGEKIVFLDMAKSIYDAQYIKELLGSEKYISYAMINAFESHKKDLKNLKELIRLIDNDGSIYKKVFSDKDPNYGLTYAKDSTPSYAYFIDCPGQYEYKKVKGYSGFLAHIKDYVGSIDTNDNPRVNGLLAIIKERIEDGDYLKRISDVNGSGFPHQLHELELNAILKNAKSHFEFLDEDKIDKIKSIFLYKLDYFDGPLDTRSEYSNVVKKDKYAKVFPWNKDEIIDKEKTNQKFIKKLINYCAYLKGEKVLPKSSILFTDFNNLNKINTLVINGDKISHKVKLALFDFINLRPKTTIKQIEKFLKENFYKDGATISGVDMEGNMSFLSPVRPILAKCFDLSDKKVCEEIDDIIIESLTIYASDKKNAIIAIKKAMPNLTEQQEKTISRLNCKDWATISKKFLTHKYPDSNGVVTSSIIDLLKDEELNLQQILNDKRFDIYDEIDRINSDARGSSSTRRKQIEDIIEAAPPMMRRPAIQALKIAYEIKKVAKSSPEMIMMEVTRTNKAEKGSKGRKKSRKEQIEELIKPILKDKDVLYKNAASNVKKELDELEDELKLKSESIYLWFMQLGFDMYSFERIDLEDVLKSDKYDIDHIVSQSSIKDDSLDNKVLVSKDVNEKVKKDAYPLNQQIVSKCLSLWKYLKEKNLISDKKYNALVRRSELTEDEINDFIQRQINVTNYSNKLVRDIFKIAFPQTKIIFQKAENASFIRNEYDITKVRELNDTHHAVDAYLNIVAGDILDKHYSLRNIKAREKAMKLAATDEEKEKITCNPESAIKRYFKNNEDTLKLVQDTCEKQDMLLTKREKYHDGAFYGQTIKKAGSGNELVPVHAKSPMKATNVYGGYDSLATSYFIVATAKTNLNKKALIAVPIMFEKLECEKLKNELTILYRKEINLDNYNLDFDSKLYNQTVVSYKNGIFLLQSANKKRVKLIDFMPFFLERNLRTYLKKIIRLEDEITNRIAKLEVSPDFLEIARNKRGDVDVVCKEKNEELRQAIIAEISLKKYEGFNKKTSIYDSEKDSGLLESKFASLRLDEQIKRLINSIKLLNASNGWYLLTKNVFVESSPGIIKASVTGLFEKKIKL